MNVDKIFGLEIILLLFVIIGTPLIYANVNDTSISDLTNNSNDNNHAGYDFGINVGDIIIFEITDVKLINYTEIDGVTDMAIGDEIKYEILGLNSYEEDGVEETIEGIHVAETNKYDGYDEYNIYYAGAVPYNPNPIVFHKNWSAIEIDLLNYQKILTENYGAFDPIVTITNNDSLFVNYKFSQVMKDFNLTVIAASDYAKSTGIRISHTYNLSKSFVNNDYWSWEYKLDLKSYIKENRQTLGLLQFPVLAISLTFILVIVIKRK